MKAGRVFLFFTVTGLFILSTCKEVEKEMLVSTGSVTNILTTTADVAGSVLDLGEGATLYGHVYSTSPDPDINGQKTVKSSPVLGTFASSLTGLLPATKYYYKAYMSRGNTVVYGDEKYFTTASVELPELTTATVTLITHNSASAGGNITSDGGDAITARGVCWSTSENPTVETGSKTINGAGTGSFNSNLENLSSNTTYYLKAYAVNSSGTGYGNQQTFTTLVAPYITVTSPASSSHWVTGNSYFITWNDNISENVNIQLYKGVTLTNEISDNVPSTGSYSWSVNNDLTWSGTYSVKILSINNPLVYSQSSQFEIAVKPTDLEGNTYKIIHLGSQWWMAENLKVTKYSNGNQISQVTLNADWAALQTPAYCWYDNNEATYKAKFGALYNWYTILYSNVCPSGWHVPTSPEWATLITYLTDNGYGYEGSGNDIAKSLASTSEWITYPTAGTVGNNQTANNSSGFTVLSGGGRNADGTFFSVGNYGSFWSHTSETTPYSYGGILRYNSTTFKMELYDRKSGFSVRCIKD